jgi:hypothetical protein
VVIDRNNNPMLDLQRRAIRMQGCRSAWDNRWLERFWTAVSMCAQRGQNIIEFLK